MWCREFSPPVYGFCYGSTNTIIISVYNYKHGYKNYTCAFYLAPIVSALKMWVLLHYPSAFRNVSIQFASSANYTLSYWSD
jgi:ABC-type enterobactin transport system permease subunit